MLAKPKLVSPRLTRWPRFALDDEGILPSDSCVAIATPTTPEARRRLDRFAADLEELLGRKLEHRDLLLYALAFLNSSAAAFLLRIGREPTPKGSWNVNEEYLSLIRLPTPDRKTATRIFELSQHCVDLALADDVPSELEAELDQLVLAAYGLAGTEVDRAITQWVAEVRATAE
jgi:hypothetical protein